MSINKIILLGHVGKDPETKEINGTKVSQFSLATTEKGYTTKDGVKVPEKVEWHNIVAWRGLAELAEKWIKKGSQIYIEGKLTSRGWEKDGVQHTRIEVVAENIQLCGKPETKEADTTPKKGINASSDLPF